MAVNCANHIGLARMIAKRFTEHLENDAEVEEVHADALFGLVKAADGFKPRQGFRFSTYAGSTISGYIRGGRSQRHQRTQREPSLDPTLIDERVHAADGGYQSADAAAAIVPQLLSRLDSTLARVVHLRVFEGRKWRDIDRIMRRRPGQPSAYALYRMAIEAMREIAQRERIGP